MSHKLTLRLTGDDLTALFGKTDGRGKAATIQKRVLTDLLLDHQRALAKLHDLGVALIEKKGD
jgi:hypothetical protein